MLSFARHVPRWVWLSAQVVLLLVVFLYIRHYQQQGMAVGKAPAIQAKTIDAKMVSLDDFKGRAVVIYFWASWCRICRLQHQVLNDIAQDYPVITVAVWSYGVEQIKEYLRDHQLKFPVIADPYGDWAKRYGVTGVPSIFIVDKEANIRFTEYGYTTAVGLRLRLRMAEETAVGLKLRPHHQGMSQ